MNLHRGYRHRVPKVSGYLPDELYRAARDNGLSVSALAQHAIEDAVRGRADADWVRRQRERAPRVTGDVDIAALMDEVRDEFGR